MNKNKSARENILYSFKCTGCSFCLRKISVRLYNSHSCENISSKIKWCLTPSTTGGRRGQPERIIELCTKMDIKKLQDSLIDVIAEEQAKLGYMKEPIRLYYPLSSLHHFFESEGDAEAMQESLGGFSRGNKRNIRGSTGIAQRRSFLLLPVGTCDRICARTPGRECIYLCTGTVTYKTWNDVG